MPDITERKRSHIKLASDPESQMNVDNPFDKYSLPYKALPELNLKDVDTNTALYGKMLNQPLILASMTGGTEDSEAINKNIAIASEETNIAFGVGSQRVALVKKETQDSFRALRKLAPNAFIFSNIGAIQLNYGVTTADIRTVIDLVEADALYLHLNPLQEALQPEGDTNFSGLFSKIEQLVKELETPVFVKEVGHGISVDIAQKLFDMGINNIDVAGTGGTSWAWIEAKRSHNENFQKWFKDQGVPTDLAISDIHEIRPEDSIIVASGGVRNPIDGLKAMLLGANYYSAAKPFLEPALEKSPQKLINLINDWQKGLQVAMFTAGLTSVSELTR